MTKSEFFTKLSDMEVNMPFFMYAEEAADGLNRLNEQRLWIENRKEKFLAIQMLTKQKLTALSKMH